MKKEDFYKLLGIDANSSPGEANKVLRKEVRKFHPDKFQQNKEEFYEKFGGDGDDDDKVLKKSTKYTQDLNSTYQNLYKEEDPKSAEQPEQTTKEPKTTQDKFIDKVSAGFNKLIDKVSAGFNKLIDKVSAGFNKLIDKVSAGFNKVLGRSKSYDVNKSEIKGQGLDGVDGKGMSGEYKSKGTDPKSAEQPEVPSSEKEANNFNKASDLVQFMKNGDLQQVKEDLGAVKPEEAGNRTSSQTPDGTPTSESQRNSTISR